ncbi:hypothetical protein ABZW18_21355 [Streptomyces sp. NPDC004647]|uniref:hypothetical protein n=1 Tax=Streptomyces sp. NPDC004647 TaxID=3154671 RepID=UPI0033AD058B
MVESITHTTCPNFLGFSRGVNGRRPQQDAAYPEQDAQDGQARPHQNLLAPFSIEATLIVADAVAAPVE